MAQITFGSNISSLRAQRLLGQSTHSLAKAFERLSSGSRINRAGDDAAGLSVAMGLATKARVYAQGIRNINDGVSALNIADANLSTGQDIVIRLAELAQQAANGSYSLTQRRALNTEAGSLVNEFNRLVGTADFNGQKLLNASLSEIRVQLGFGNNEGIAFQVSGQLRRNVSSGRYDLSDTLGIGAALDTATADFNGDGKLDIAGVDGSNLVVEFGDGAGSFSGPVTMAMGTTPQFLVAADFNGDGKVDIATSNAGSANVSVRLGNGNGTFASATNYAVGATPGEIVAADFNNDGNVDLAVALFGGSVATLNGSATGSFSSATTYSMASGTTRIRAGDINGDGIVDLVALNTTAGTITSRLGAGNGTFGAASQVHNFGGALSDGAIELADINGDGVQDIIYGGGFSSTTLEVRLGSVSGTFGSASTIGSSLSAGEIIAGDFNGDGLIDIQVSANLPDASYQYYGNGSGSFSQVTSATIGTSYTAWAAGDFNGDGVLDLTNGGESYISRTQATSNIRTLNITTRQGALDAISELAAVLERIRKEQGIIGSGLSRLSSALNNSSALQSVLQGGASRITDADVASESASATRLSIMQNAAQSVLAQANQQPALALQLLAT